MSKIKNAFHDEICSTSHLAELATNEASECPDCDGFGICWNNADPTSGMWAACETCGDTRGQP